MAGYLKLWLFAQAERVFVANERICYIFAFPCVCACVREPWSENVTPQPSLLFFSFSLSSATAAPHAPKANEPCSVCVCVCVCVSSLHIISRTHILSVLNSNKTEFK